MMSAGISHLPALGQTAEQQLEMINAGINTGEQEKQKSQVFREGALRPAEAKEAAAQGSWP